MTDFTELEGVLVFLLSKYRSPFHENIAIMEMVVASRIDQAQCYLGALHALGSHGHFSWGLECKRGGWTSMALNWQQLTLGG